ncbi:hypothetical protein K2173_023144 [Erythroxylum novogranatense]|uniref:Protein GAMETE EXPRESSED 3 n=1 Tax=Erythroxylum novogranatense TaxID=1862640 RepID=A0AAV8UBA6_9ROSI|nr:hypothetical protein K2173_023144 [Erythroxylum novogranatense]
MLARLLACLLVFSPIEAQNFPGQGPSTGFNSRLSKPLIGDDNRIYTCSDRNLFAFLSNGSIFWSLRLAYTCNVDMAPVHGGRGKLYLIAENRVLKVNFLDVGTSPPTADVFFGPEKGQEGAGDIIGIAVSTSSSLVFITVKERALFAYTMGKHLMWSAGPVLSQFGYRIGCSKGIEDCYFNSAPVIDRCEASIHMSNTKGELYSLSLGSPHFNWIQDLSSFGKTFTITPGNNGRIYVSIPTRALVLALDVSTGNILWQKGIGPLSRSDCHPVVDSNGWISISSVDGFLYSISPAGELRKFTKASELDYVVQTSPYLDCSGYAVYFSQTQMEGKTSNKFDDYTYISAMRPKGAVFTLLVPATGTFYWSESYPGRSSCPLSQSDLLNFAVDERILLCFFAASGTGNPLSCRNKYEKLVSTCSQTRPKNLNVYTGNDKTILVFLLFESLVMVVMVGLVRFCCIFWRKKKLQGQGLGDFLRKRRSLQLKKKAFDRTITEIQEKVSQEAVAHEAIEELGTLVRERDGIQRKLLTTYSLGRDGRNLKSRSILPVYNEKTRSYSYQSPGKENVTIFHTVSDTSSRESSSESESTWNAVEEKNYSAAAKYQEKGKAPVEVESSSDDETFFRTPSESAPSSSGHLSSGWEVVQSRPSTGRRSSWLKRRKALSSTN